MLDNKVIVITGGASGLGLAIAEALFKQNGQILVFDCNPEPFETLSQHFDCYEVDVTDEQQIEQAVTRVIQKYGQIDVLVNNAGIIHSQPLVNIMDPEQRRHSYQAFKKVINIDLDSVFLMTSMVAEQMIMKRTKGVIINISSISAQGKAGQTAYAAAKAGVEAMTRVWAKELAGFGIRTNAIAPGFINTPSTSDALNEQLIKDIKQMTPMKKLGEVEHIVQAAIYAIENGFVNGSVLEVDGGLVI